MRESIYNRVKVVRALDATTIATNANTDGVAVGLDQSGADFRVATAVVYAGALTDGSYAAVVQESANGTTGWTDVPAERLQGSASVSAANGVAEVGVIPNPAAAPFLRVRVVSTGTTTGGSIGALFLLGSSGRSPVAR